MCALRCFLYFLFQCYEQFPNFIHKLVPIKNLEDNSLKSPGDVCGDIYLVPTYLVRYAISSLLFLTSSSISFQLFEGSSPLFFLFPLQQAKPVSLLPCLHPNLMTMLDPQPLKHYFICLVLLLSCFRGNRKYRP